MAHSYVHPETLKKAQTLLGKEIPKPDTNDWDDFLYELGRSDDQSYRALADELNQNVIFSGVGDPREKQVKAVRRNQTKQNWLHRLFYRDGEEGKHVLNKLKVTGLIMGTLFTLFTVAFFSKGFVTRGKAEAQPAPAAEVPVANVETETPFQVGMPPFERPGAEVADLPAQPEPAPDDASDPTPNPAPSPTPNPAPSPAPESAATSDVAEPPATVTRSALVEGGMIARSAPREKAVLVSSGSVERGAVTSSSNKTSGSITSSKSEADSSIASSNEGGSVAGGSSPTVSTGGTERDANAQAAVSDTTAPDPEENTTTSTPETAATQEMPEAEAGELQGFEAALQRAREDLAGREPVSEPVAYSVGDMLDGSLVFGVMTTGEDELPVLVIDENNVMWRGTAKLNALARVEISLTHFIQNGAETPKTATVLDTDSYPGIKATMREAAPTLAADMIQASLKGVTDYVRDLASNRTTTLLEDQVILQDQVVPLEWAIAGSLTELFTPPQPAQALVRVGEVPVATQVKIMILQ